MESFEGSVGGLTGAFNFVHSASTSGPDRTGEYFAIVPSSGTGQLAGITGDGGLALTPTAPTASGSSTRSAGDVGRSADRPGVAWP